MAEEVQRINLRVLASQAETGAATRVELLQVAESVGRLYGEVAQLQTRNAAATRQDVLEVEVESLKREQWRLPGCAPLPEELCRQQDVQEVSRVLKQASASGGKAVTARAGDGGDGCSDGWKNLGSSWEGYVCDVTEDVGGWVQLANGPDCDRGFKALLNPAVWLPSPAAGIRTGAAFEVLRPGVLILAESPPNCSFTDFLQTDHEVAGRAYFHESRMDLLENSLESPATGQGRAVGLCPIRANDLPRRGPLPHRARLRALEPAQGALRAQRLQPRADREGLRAPGQGAPRPAAGGAALRPGLALAAAGGRGPAHGALGGRRRRAGGGAAGSGRAGLALGRGGELPERALRRRRAGGVRRAL